jgi:DNA-directed RNA polymerase II subunit RPB2
MDIFKSFSEYYPIAAHHINSFKEWQLFGLKKTLSAQTLTSNFKKWHFINVRMNKPLMTPIEAEERGVTYEAKIIVDVVETNLKDLTSITIPDIEIAHVPIIVYPEDEGSDGIGGYFIISGLARILVTQIRQAYNQPLTTFAKNESKKNRIRPTNILNCKPSNSLATEISNSGKTSDSIFIQVNVRSISEASNHSCATEIILTSQNQLLMANSKYNGRLEVALILKALGCETLDHYRTITLQDEEIAKDLWISSFIAKDQEEALKLLAWKLSFKQRSVEEYKIDFTKVLNFLTKELFPHLGLTTTSTIVSIYIASLVKKLYIAKRTGKVDDRDSLVFKRFEPAGVLISELFEQTVKKWISLLSKFCMKKNNLIMGIQPIFISKRIAYCFATSTWGAPQGNYTRMGVSQIRAMNSYIAQMSHLYRVSNPISKETRNQLVRQLHPTHQYYLCPCESPEGHTIGIVLNFAISAYITPKIYPVILIDALQHMIKPLTLCGGREIKHTVSINGCLIGLTENVSDFVNEFVYLRRIGAFDGGLNLGMVSIGIVEQQILIWCDVGRVVRPIKIRQESNTNWRQGLLSGQFQWIDPFEIEFGPVDHSSERNIHPSLMFSITTASIPFINFEQAPRAAYAANMNKQAVCSIGPCQTQVFGNFNIGRIQHVPIVSTKVAEIKGLNNFPTGVNIIVAICSIDGYNQEDAVVLNRASVERGLFAADSYQTFEVNEGIEGEDEKKICLPTRATRNKLFNYCMLDANGIIKKGFKVYANDVLVGQVLKTPNGVCDISTIVSKTEEGIVDNVIVNINDGFKFVKVVIIRQLNVIVGDKVASTFGQKGVVGAIKNSWDLPFMKDGTVPDLFINPLCLPSRMTIPTIMESLFGLVAIETNQMFQTNSFESIVVGSDGLKIECCPNENGNDVRSIIKKLKMNPNGCVEMIHPETGELMVPIFCGPQYYNRLCHFAEKKCYGRSIGAYSKLTHQPPDGRSRDGGLRIGAMEKDAMIGLGLRNVLDDRLFHCSDPFYINICDDCEMVALNSSICLCGSNNVSKVKCSFTSNLLFAQFRAMGAKLLFGTKQKEIAIEQIEDEEIFV